MEKILILIPSTRPPTFHSVGIIQIKNIINKLKRNYKVKLLWLIFQPSQIQEIENDNEQIIDFKKYKNAIEILKKFKPDLLLIEGELSCYNLTLAMAGKFKKIPIISSHLEGDTILENSKKGMAITPKLNLLFSKRVIGDISDDEKPERFRTFKFLFTEYKFLLKTLQAMNYNILKIIKFMTFYPRVQIFTNSIEPIHKKTSGDLNLCSKEKRMNRLLESGFKQSSLLLVGDPYFDNLFEEIQKLDRSLDMNQRKNRILLCPDTMHEHGYCSEKEEFSFIKKIIEKIIEKRMKIAIKIHPSTASLKEYEKEFSSYDRDNLVIFQKEDLVKLSLEFDVIITYGGSSVLLYMLILRKPIVFVNFLGHSELNYFFDKKIMTECNNINNIIEKISESKSKKIDEIDYKKYLETHIGKFYGNSSEIAANGILEILKKRVKSDS